MKVRLRLEQAVINLNARRLVLLKFSKPIRSAHVPGDMKASHLIFVMSSNAVGVAPPPISEVLPRPVDVSDLAGYENHHNIIFTDFWEFPSRPSAKENSYILTYMEENESMALVGHHMKDRQGYVVGVLAVHYSYPHQFTDVDRNMIKSVARELRLLLPWLAWE